MSYELLLMDADGTLFDFEKAESHALEKLFGKYKFNESNNVLLEKYKRINTQLWDDLEFGKITSAELKVERFKRLFTECKVDTDFCEVSKQYVEFLSEGNFLLDGAEEICQYLSKKYTLAIITNGITEVQYARFESSPLVKYINHLIVSGEAGSQKPSPEIFEYTFNKLGFSDKKSSIIIGDSLSSDIQGGINFGIDTCWYNPGNVKNDKNLPVTMEIHDLYEIKRIF